MRAALGLAAVPLLVGGAVEAGMWEYGVKLVPVEGEEERKYSVSMFGTRLRLVVRAWLTCQWVNVFAVTEALLRRVDMSKEQVYDVRRCGRSIRENCHFYEASLFEERTGMALGPDVHGSVLGYFVQDSDWLDAEPEECEDRASFRFVKHPLQWLHPEGLDGWLSRQLHDQGLDVASVADASRPPTELAMDAMRDVYSDDVAEVWESLWPGDSSARQMIIIGCGNLHSEPTQPLLDKGTGGLFVDASTKAIRQAKYSSYAGPHRVILNRTVDPANVVGLLREHAPSLWEVDVVQVDIDTVDGPVLMKILEVTSPRAVVVELRNFVPFPFRYAYFATDTDGLKLGGATLAFWMHELRVRGFELERMDRRDAVFVRRPPGASADLQRRHFLAAMGCYMCNLLREPTPAFLLRGPRAPLIAGAPVGSAEESWDLLRHAWMEMPASVAFPQVWRNLTSWRPDLPFSLTF
uniref:Methyltransferase FkbM domain-containing protein n=1 Tax=Alexandrium monilatum TaxID=311494 RepID=A0A7S4WC06_9DINO